MSCRLRLLHLLVGFPGSCSRDLPWDEVMRSRLGAQLYSHLQGNECWLSIPTDVFALAALIAGVLDAIFKQSLIFPYKCSVGKRRVPAAGRCLCLEWHRGCAGKGSVPCWNHAHPSLQLQSNHSEGIFKLHPSVGPWLDPSWEQNF